MSRVTVSIQCFGAFRQFGDCIYVDVSAGASIAEVKAALIRRLGPEQEVLVNESVLANDNDVLPSTYILQEEISLSILPPVCGG